MLLVILAPLNWAVVGMFGISFIAGGLSGASMVASLGVVPANLRGTMTAVMTFCISVIGGGLGPVAFGALNDQLKGDCGDAALRYTLIAVPITWALSALGFWLAGRTAVKGMAAANGPE